MYLVNMKKYLLVFLGFILIFPLQYSAQTFPLPSPTFGPAFLQSEVATIEVFLESEDWDYILHPDNEQSNVEHPATFIYTSVAGSDTMYNVGFRLRGNTSRAAGKKSFKVSMNTFVTGQKWNGLEKLNLNGEHNDPSIMRARMVWELMRSQDMVAPRYSHVELYVNGEYRGLYLNLEHVDENFLAKRFVNPFGKLWKCTYPADLSYNGSDGEDYMYPHEWDDTRVYDLKLCGTGMNGDPTGEDYSAIAELATILHEVSTDNLKCEIEQVFDVSSFLKLAALEILVGHWDNYFGNMNNYYLYERPEDGKLMMFTYDVDNTLGVQWWGDYANQNPFDYSPTDFRPLYDRLMEVEEYRDMLGAFINAALEDGFNGPDWAVRGNELIALCTPAALNDTYRTLDYGFDNNDFLQSVSTAWGGHISNGIAPYVLERTNSITSQINLDNQLRSLQAYAKTPVHNDTLTIYAETYGSPSYLNATIFPNNASSFTSPLSEIEPGLWRVDVALTGVTSTEWIVNATYENNVSLPTVINSPCTPGKAWIFWLPSPNFVLNEIMPLNNSFNQDPYGGFPDWAEIYNSSASPASVANMYLTDNIDVPTKYKFPEFTVEPNDHRLIYLENALEQGPLHAPFHIDSSGDDLTLITWDDFGWRVVDRVVWSDALPVNTSYGRIEDGYSEWMTFVPLTNTPPTPLAANSGMITVPCPEDLNGDGSITVQDVLIVLANFGCAEPEPCIGDIDSSNYVGVSDVLEMLSAFGSNC
jgi:hypothetical protein